VLVIGRQASAGHHTMNVRMVARSVPRYAGC
jgi:hypothetical protein